MAKKVTGYIKLQIPAGKATPAPPVGPALGQHGVNIVEFTKQFNAKTADQDGMIIPVVITVYNDRSFSFITKTPPAAVFIKKADHIDNSQCLGTPALAFPHSCNGIRCFAGLRQNDQQCAAVDQGIGIPQLARQFHQYRNTAQLLNGKFPSSPAAFSG